MYFVVVALSDLLRFSHLLTDIVLQSAAELRALGHGRGRSSKDKTPPIWVTGALEEMWVPSSAMLWVPSYSLKTLRTVWIAVVLWCEVCVFIAASARCHWPDLVRLLHSFYYFAMGLILSRENANRLAFSSSLIHKFSIRDLTRSDPHISEPSHASSST
jgi:hypothetical protein